MAAFFLNFAHNTDGIDDAYGDSILTKIQEVGDTLLIARKYS